MVSKEDYEDLLNKGKLRKAVSWKGTFTYPHNGAHLEWNKR
jgi:hypothetical protein